MRDYVQLNNKLAHIRYKPGYDPVRFITEYEMKMIIYLYVMIHLVFYVNLICAGDKRKHENDKGNSDWCMRRCQNYLFLFQN